jgi:hypothetical protein
MQALAYERTFQRRLPKVAKSNQMILRKVPEDIKEYLKKYKAQLNNSPDADHTHTQQEIMLTAMRDYMKKHPLGPDKSRKPLK